MFFSRIVRGWLQQLFTMLSSLCPREKLLQARRPSTRSLKTPLPFPRAHIKGGPRIRGSIRQCRGRRLKGERVAFLTRLPDTYAEKKPKGKKGHPVKWKSSQHR